MRKALRYEDPDAKRKNSNSDKEDASEQALIHGRNVNVVAKANPNNVSEMQHRQRKPTGNNNNTTNNSSSAKLNSCDKTGNDVDYHDSEVLLKDGGRVVEQLKMATFHSSPTYSPSIASSNQTEQTHCDNSPRNNHSKNNNNQSASVDTDAALGPGDVAVEPRAPLAGHDSMHSLNGSIGEETAGAVVGSHKARVRDQATTFTSVVSSAFHLLIEKLKTIKNIYTMNHANTTHSHTYISSHDTEIYHLLSFISYTFSN